MPKRKATSTLSTRSFRLSLSLLTNIQVPFHFQYRRSNFPIPRSKMSHPTYWPYAKSKRENTGKVRLIRGFKVYDLNEYCIFLTGQTTRVIQNNNSKIAYIFFIAFGIPITILTFRATGKRLNLLVYSIIRFINVKIFKRQLTSHIHLKAIIINFIFFMATFQLAVVVFMMTQKWKYLDSAFFTANMFFSIGNNEMYLNEEFVLNSQEDKAYRVLFNFISFVAYTVLGSFVWSAHLFTRHMRFKAQNNQLARTNGNTNNVGTARRNCPWVEVTRSRGSSPTKSLCKERETDRESVC